jgi:Tol biopolymer transport system component
VFELKISPSGRALGTPGRVTADLGALSFDISDDGSHLAYAKFELKSNLAVLPSPKTGPVSSATALLLTTGAQTVEGVSVTRDGKFIAYDSNRSGNQDIYRIVRKDGPELQLTHSLQDDFQPAWSPDQQSIAFYSFRNGNRDLYVMSADGSDQQQVTSDPAQERYPDWAPDGRLVFYSDKTGHHEIYVVSRENGQWKTPKQLTFTEQGAMHPRWAPDGQTIVYSDISKGLCLISPDGNNMRLLVPKESHVAMFAAWSGDSKTIYFRLSDDQRRRNIWSVPAKGGTPTLLVRFENLSRLEFATDDNSFFFPIAERESDIWRLRLER